MDIWLLIMQYFNAAVSAFAETAAFCIINILTIFVIIGQIYKSEVKFRG